jgi:hypothetical protein
MDNGDFLDKGKLSPGALKTFRYKEHIPRPIDLTVIICIDHFYLTFDDINELTNRVVFECRRLL